jgi:NAD(P)-dependent dehydrogenase (short-subunit alcohol dehydrogenase family)
VPYLKRRGGGSILITSSVNGNRKFACPGAAAYCASKAAQVVFMQVVFMKMMALELGRHHIRCNAICPGAIPTNIEENTVHRNPTASASRSACPTETRPSIRAGASFGTWPTPACS